MTQAKTKRNSDGQATSPVTWFAVLERARAIGDFETAARAIKRLRELGVDVRYTAGAGQ